MLTSSGTEVISAIDRPVILILTTSSLITATASRQSKILEHVRSLTEVIEKSAGLVGGKRKFLLIRESRIALSSVDAEMDYVRGLALVFNRSLEFDS